MKKNLSAFALLLILCSCAGFEFVIKKEDSNSSIKSLTTVAASGDNSSQVYLLLRDSFGDNKDNNAQYSLSVFSEKDEVAKVIKKDATASKFDITYTLHYTLYNIDKGCDIFNKKIKTVSTYNSRSAGYSFGTDLSEKESNTININKNIDEFMLSLNEVSDLNSCKN